MHHLQVTGGVCDLHARCFCGGWEMRDPSWEWSNGHVVRLESWESFEAHVRDHTPNVVKAYHLSGWHRNIPAHQRASTNMSNGAKFSTIRRALEYVKHHNFAVSGLEPILVKPDDPEVDFFSQTRAEQDRRMGY